MKLMNPLVTISIPLYKCADFLEGCLNSVLKQTYANIEVTLINDDTPDNSVQIAKDFIAKHQLERWKIINLEKNSGLSVVRNKGIDTANGKYLFFLDSDDQILPQAVALFVKQAEEKNVQMVVGDVETINIESGAISDTFSVQCLENEIKGNQKVFDAFVKGEFPSTSWNKLIDVNFLRENQLYFTPGLFAQDALQSFQTALKLESIGFLHQNTYRYFLHENSIIHNRNKRNFDNWFTIGQYIDKEYKKETDNARKNLIMRYLIDYKSLTLQMNWRAQKNEEFWKESYHNYKKLSSLSWRDYFSNDYSFTIKKSNLFNQFPTGLGFKIFKWRYER